MHAFDVWSGSLDPLDPDDEDDGEGCLTKDTAAALLLPVESISTMALFMSLNCKELR